MVENYPGYEDLGRDFEQEEENRKKEICQSQPKSQNQSKSSG